MGKLSQVLSKMLTAAVRIYQMNNKDLKELQSPNSGKDHTIVWWWSNATLPTFILSMKISFQFFGIPLNIYSLIILSNSVSFFISSLIKISMFLLPLDLLKYVLINFLLHNSNFKISIPYHKEHVFVVQVDLVLCCRLVSGLPTFHLGDSV